MALVPGSALRSVRGDNGTGAGDDPQHRSQSLAETWFRRFRFPRFGAIGNRHARQAYHQKSPDPAKAALAAVEAAEYFDVTAENGRIVLTPARVNRACAVRAKLAELGLSEADVNAAVAWARPDE